MGEPALTSKSLKQLANEAYALSGYLRHNPTDAKALNLLISTAKEMKQLQEVIQPAGVSACPSDRNYAAGNSGVGKVIFCGSIPDYLKQQQLSGHETEV